VPVPVPDVELPVAWLAGLGRAAGCDPLAEPCVAEPPDDTADPADDTAEPADDTVDPADDAEDTAEDAADTAGDTALPTVWGAVGPWEDPAVPETTEPTGFGTGGTGVCAAAAGRAKITARIKVSMKAAARPPQAYRHTRRVQTPTFVRPIQERMATFPSTACKARQTLGHAAITHPVRRTSSGSSGSPRTRGADLGERPAATYHPGHRNISWGDPR